MPAPVQASVLAFAIREFAQLGPGERARLRDQLRGIVRNLLPHWHEDTRIVLESEDGALIVGLTGPVRVLEAAQAAPADPQLGVALHHGAVQALQHEGTTVLLGDGIETAQAVALRPGANGLTATRDFRRALLAAAPAQREELRPAGDFTDSRLRSHELYGVDPAAARRRRMRRLVASGAIVVGLLALGLAGRLAREHLEASRKPAIVLLDIKPAGEVWVDGEFKGPTPPLTRMALAPGAHVIEVRNPRSRPLRMDVQLKASEEIEIRHVFLPQGAPLQRRNPSFWDRFKW